MPSVTTSTLEHPAASVLIRELADGRRQITVSPRKDDYFIFYRECVTKYPLDLIALILQMKSPKPCATRSSGREPRLRSAHAQVAHPLTRRRRPS